MKSIVEELEQRAEAQTAARADREEQERQQRERDQMESLAALKAGIMLLGYDPDSISYRAGSHDRYNDGPCFASMDWYLAPVGYRHMHSDWGVRFGLSLVNGKWAVRDTFEKRLAVLTNPDEWAKIPPPPPAEPAQPVPTPPLPDPRDVQLGKISEALRTLLDFARAEE